MQAIAERTRHLPDAKALRLVDWIRDNLCPDLPPFEQQAKRRHRQVERSTRPDLHGEPRGHEALPQDDRPIRSRWRPTGPSPSDGSHPLGAFAAPTSRELPREALRTQSAPGLSLATTSTRNMPRGPALDQRRGRCLPPVATEVASCAPATPTIEMTLLAAKDLTRDETSAFLISPEYNPPCAGRCSGWPPQPAGAPPASGYR